MDDGVSQNSEENSQVVETELGGKEFRGAIEHREPGAPELKPAPEGVPEKFWDPLKGELRSEDLIKSYTELSKKLGAPKDETEEVVEDEAEKPTDETDEGTDEGGEEKPEGEGEDEGEDDSDSDGADAVLASAIEGAQAEYAKSGDLSAETRTALAEQLTKVGIPADYIDFHLQGVKATEAALQGAAAEAAGSAEDLQAAMEWAGKAWANSPKKAQAFNAAMGDVETIKLAVPGLMQEYRAANPGEGKLHNINNGGNLGDIYSSMDEFTQDLDKADKTRDKVARKKAIDKLARSRAAGSVKSQRRSPFGG